jgi:hypothetical protein
MPSWAVTGKLGGGKTLWAVRMIRNYLSSGRPVATNIDIFPENFLKPTRDEKTFCLYRLPDQISRADLDTIGVANQSNDEQKNGLLVIDESGVSLNARTYSEAGRKDLIEWFLHARKLGWDLMFIVQSVSLIDKQIREAILEYKATCKRMDRLSVPVLVWFGIKLRMPRFHFVIIRYGLETNATIADRDIFRGNDLFSAFNTKQLLTQAKERAGVFSVLSPWHLKGRYMSKFDLIKSAAAISFSLGIVIGGASGWFSKQYIENHKPAPVIETLPTVASGMVRDDLNSLPKLILKNGDIVQVTHVSIRRRETIYHDRNNKAYTVEK